MAITITKPGVLPKAILREYQLKCDKCKGEFTCTSEDFHSIERNLDGSGYVTCPTPGCKQAIKTKIR